MKESFDQVVKMKGQVRMGQNKTDKCKNKTNKQQTIKSGKQSQQHLSGDDPDVPVPLQAGRVGLAAYQRLCLHQPLHGRHRIHCMYKLPRQVQLPLRPHRPSSSRCCRLQVLVYTLVQYSSSTSVPQYYRYFLTLSSSILLLKTSQPFLRHAATTANPGAGLDYSIPGRQDMYGAPGVYSYDPTPSPGYGSPGQGLGAVGGRGSVGKASGSPTPPQSAWSQPGSTPGPSDYPAYTPGMSPARSPGTGYR